MVDCEGRDLECFVQRNYEDDSPPDLLVLKFPGTAGRAERSTEFPSSMLNVPKMSLWTWNPPGYGKSPGRASLSAIAEAATAFYRTVTQQQVGPTTTVWLCGNSLGCVTALHVAADTQPNPAHSGLLLRNPPPLRRVVQRIADRYPHFGLVNPVIESLCDPMDALNTAKQVKLPGVFLQSELDTLVPIELQDEIIHAYGGAHQVVLMEGLGHGCLATEDHEPSIEASVNWLWDQTGFDKREL
ncbi:MAG: alpha/beta hydrolase [Rubripirellula sp.]